MIWVRAILVNRTQIRKVYPVLYNQLSFRLKSSRSNEITPSSSNKRTEIGTDVKTLGEKVKETSVTATYLGVILAGLGVAGLMCYTIFGELFSSQSPNNIYSKAAEKCIKHPQVSDKLGYPIKIYGDETRRGRRQHVSHALYVDREGKKHLGMKFHLKGTAHSGTAQLDMVETISGNYEYRYLFVEVNDMFKSVIVVEDNRNQLDSQSTMHGLQLQL